MHNWRNCNSVSMWRDIKRFDKIMDWLLDQHNTIYTLVAICNFICMNIFEPYDPYRVTTSYHLFYLSNLKKRTRTGLVVGSIPTRGNEIFIFIYILIFSLWCRGQARRWVQLFNPPCHKFGQNVSGFQISLIFYVI